MIFFIVVGVFFFLYEFYYCSEHKATRSHEEANPTRRPEAKEKELAEVYWRTRGIPTRGPRHFCQETRGKCQQQRTPVLGKEEIRGIFHLYAKLIQQDGPLEYECHIAAGATNITVCSDKVQYQASIHRMRFFLTQRALGVEINSTVQATHLCPNHSLVGKPCSNPEHLVPQDAKGNQGRDNCGGWVWVRPYKGHEGNFWFPTCAHDPPCLTYTPKKIVPTLCK